MIILLHSSKTMRLAHSDRPQRQPTLIAMARTLNTYLKTLSLAQLERSMHISPHLAKKTEKLIADWGDTQSIAIDSFVGDIYSGLRAADMSQTDRDYADTTIWILSGLYGFLRPFDSVCPYRLEMGYVFDGPEFKSLYTFWGDTIAKQLPPHELIVNISSAEYTKVILPYIDSSHVVTPQFLTADPKTGKPRFTAVHAKIARGAFARWLVMTKITDSKRFKEFTDLGYHYDETLSTPSSPTFVCQTFGGLGLSIRSPKDDTIK